MSTPAKPNETPSLDAIPLALEAFRLADARTRQHARGVLRDLGEHAVGPLLAALPSCGDRARREVFRVLRSIADPHAAEALMQGPEDRNADCRWVAAEGLVELGHSGLARTLRELEEYPANTRKLRALHHVLSGLRATGYAHVVQPVLRAFLSNIPEIDVPRAAARAEAKLRLMPPPPAED